MIFVVAGAITMATDCDCRHLVTGDGNGLIKVWNITDYCTDISEDAPVTKAPCKQVTIRASFVLPNHSFILTRTGID